MRSLEIGSSALDGSDYRRLTNHEALDSNPAWSPDGNRIAFFSNRENARGAIYTMAADGSDVRGMTPQSLYVLQESPLWSPDGRYIAFFTQEERGRGLYTVGSDGSGLTRVSGAHVAVWSSDGRRIAFGVEDEFRLRLYTSNPDGSDVREVTQPEWPRFERIRSSQTEDYLFWSPDGSEILLLADQRSVGPSIYAFAVDGSGLRAIAEDIGPRKNVVFSPDGSRIAIRDEAHPSIVMYTVAADGSDPRGLVWDLGTRHDSNRVPEQPNVENLVTQTTASGQLEQPEPLVKVTATPCGLAAYQTGNPGLVRDCMTLLAAKDTLRGTATLNWSVDVAIGSWEGVTTSGTPSRVTEVDLSSESLSGTIPAELGTLFELTTLDLSSNSLTGSIPAELGWLFSLEELRLSGNSLTSCIPVALQDIATNDLSSLNLLYCTPPAPENLTAETVTQASVPLSWDAVTNVSKYRVEYRLRPSSDWTTDSDTLTTTSHTVDELEECGSTHLFRVSAYGSGTVNAAAWSEPSAILAVETGECVSPVVR